MAPGGQRVSPPDDPEKWAAAIRRHLEPDAWAQARVAGVAAAERVLADGPVGRAERILVAARAGASAQ
jgi:hypothetical protein